MAEVWNPGTAEGGVEGFDRPRRVIGEFPAQLGHGGLFHGWRVDAVLEPPRDALVEFVRLVLFAPDLAVDTADVEVLAWVFAGFGVPGLSDSRRALAASGTS